jgi:hypothetical protein
MSLLSIFTGLNGYLLGAGAILIAFVATYLKGRLSGAARERDRQAAKERDSYAKHLQEISDAADARPSGKLSDDPNNRDR